MLETIISFIALILVLVLAYFSTRYFAKTMHKMQSSDSMHIVESILNQFIHTKGDKHEPKE